MSNVQDLKRKDIIITAGDNIPRKLKFSLNAFAELELKYGSVDDAIKKMEEGSMVAIRFILWQGLKTEDESLTEEQVGNILEVRDFEHIMTQITAAMGMDLPTKEETDPN